MKKIKILYDFLKELGGLERVVFFQANVLKNKYKTDLMFSFVSDKEKDSIIDELGLKKGVKIFQFRKGRNELLQYLQTMLFPKKVKKIDADLIISHSYMCSRIAYWQKIKNRIPYAVMIHHPPNFLYSKQKGWINNPARLFAKMAGVILRKSLIKKDIESVRNADIVIANSKYTANRVKEIYGVKPVIIYPSLASTFKMLPEKDKKEFLKAKNINKKFMLAHGRIIPDKNYIDILPMIKNIKEFNLIISGTVEKDYKQKLIEEVKRNNLENRVKILGRISKEDLLMYYNTAELFLMPAHKEDFGLTVIEAMACGCPIIAWDDGAGPSEIIDKNSGILCKPYDKKEFIGAINSGLLKKWDRKKVSDSAQRFSEESISKLFDKTINKIIGKG